VILGDTAVTFLSDAMDIELREAMITKDGGELIQ
jgi:hypothetical protein